MKNNRTFLFFVFFFTFIIFVSFALFFGFLRQNNLSWSDYWQKPDLYGSIPIPKLQFARNMKNIHKEVAFPLMDKIKITVDIESVSFIEENRDDILIVYDYLHPATQDYNIDFKSFVSDDEIQIIAVTQAKEKGSLPFSPANLDGIYRGSVEIRLPIDYQLDTLSLTTSTLDIEPKMLYENADNYILTSSMGNIDFAVTKPKRMVSVDSDLGDITVLAQAKIDVFDLISNLGNAHLNFQKPLDTLYIVNSFGSNTIILEDKLDSGNIQNNVGNIQLYTHKGANSLNVFTLSGDILAYITSNPSTYLDSTEGTIHSYFKTVDINAVENPLFYISSEAGNIRLLPPSMDTLKAMKQEFPYDSFKKKKSAEARISTDRKKNGLKKNADAVEVQDASSFHKILPAKLPEEAIAASAEVATGSSIKPE